MRLDDFLATLLLLYVLTLWALIAWPDLAVP